ncbi:hypothetical protein BDW59DRAFT_158620 [Aspergillus cavernicola]|uniref:Zn(2)-C6 fungal-type domain-containing protein n=1 Tax=Aspergillus cavernicola TaxID=176166 RepID=A0ABR4IRK7_9EURO
MSLRQSCDRCRQQKVRCLRDEAQAQRGSPSPDRASKQMWIVFTAVCAPLNGFFVCVTHSCIVKQQSTRHTAQTSVRKETNRGPKNGHGHSHSLDDTSWFEQSLTGTNFASKVTPTQFPGLDENGAAFNHVNGWDASLQSLLTPATFFNCLSAAPDVAPITTRTSAALFTTSSRQDSSEGVIDDDDDDDDDNDRDPSTTLSSQLTSLSQWARRARRP